MFSKSRSFSIALLFLGVLAVRHLNAQGATGSIQGTVTDMSGAAIAGASVQAKNTATGTTQTTTADGQGRFNLPDLGVGTYEVQASQAGFSTVVHKGVALAVGAQTVVDFSLPVGQQQQTVTVEGQVTQVETTNATVGAVINQTQMLELPLNGRDFEQLILLAPGVQQVTAFTALSFQGRAPEYSIGGTRPEGQTILLDDESLQNYWNKGMGSVTGSSIGVEAIDQFETLTNMYSAQIGGNGGAVVAVSKSGTNSFHGSAYEFLRNSDFDARRFIDPSTIPAFRRNNFGGSLGGPIKKDKMFFFVNYEGLRQTLGETNVAMVPACNVPGVCTPTFPQATNPTAYNTIVNTLALYPLPDPGTVSGQIGRSTQVANQTGTENYVLGRYDYNISAKDSVFIRYVSDLSGFFEPFAGGGFAPGQLPFWPETDSAHLQFTTTEWRHIISPTMVNVARASFSRPGTAAATTPSAMVNGVHPLQFLPGREDADVAIGGLSAVGPASLVPFNTTQNRFTEGDDIIWTHGAHNIRFGAAFSRLQTNTEFFYLSGSSWSFQGLSQFLGGGVVPGTGPASLSFVPTTLPNGQAPYAHRDIRDVEFYPYIQDDWKVTPKLTLNLGLRYEFESNPIEVHNQLYAVTNFRTATTFSNVPHAWGSNPNDKNFAPRLGFAYDPFADHKTSIRGGFGIFYSLMTPADYLATYWNATPWTIFSAGTSVPGVPVPVYSFVPTNAPTTPADNTGYDWNSNKSPYTIEYNLTVQRQITPSTLLTVGFIGSRGVHLLTQNQQNPSLLINGVTGVLNASGTAITPNPKLNPALGSFLDLIPTTLMRYNSMQVGVTRRFAAGLTGQLSYTYSKCQDDGSYLGSFNSNTTANWENPYNQYYDWSVCNYDITNVLVVNASYALPLHGNRLKEGWELNGILRSSGGLPFTITNGIDTSGLGTFTRPNSLTGNVSPILGTPARWFDPTQFAPAPLGTLGDLGRLSAWGPGVNNTDFGLFKDTTIRESMRLQFRAEFFNIFNHTNYGLPTSTLYTSLTEATSVNGVATVPIPGTTARAVPNPNAGRITSIVGNPRQIQLALKFIF